MRKTKIMAGLLASTSLAGTLLGGTAAFAAGEGGTGHSDAEILFERSTALPDVEEIPGLGGGEDEDGNPIEPDEDIKTPDGEAPLDPDYFRLIYVPTEFGFGSHSVEEVDYSTGNATFAIANDSAANPSTKRVAVGDKRGTKAGWELTAELEGSLADGAKTLEGATINVDTITPNKLNEESWDYISGATGTPTAGTNVKIGLEASPIMTAPAGDVMTGQGIWEASLSDIELEVPGAALANVENEDTYTGTVVWTLSDVPNVQEEVDGE